LPYCLYIGIRTGLKGLNLIGLKRNKISNENIKIILSFIKNLFDKNSTIDTKLKNLDDKYLNIKEIDEMIEFIQQSNKRGITPLYND